MRGQELRQPWQAGLATSKSRGSKYIINSRHPRCLVAALSRHNQLSRETCTFSSDLNQSMIQMTQGTLWSRDVASKISNSAVMRNAALKTEPPWSRTSQINDKSIGWSDQWLTCCSWKILRIFSCMSITNYVVEWTSCTACSGWWDPDCGLIYIYTHFTTENWQVLTTADHIWSIWGEKQPKTSNENRGNFEKQFTPHQNSPHISTTISPNKGGQHS